MKTSTGASIISMILLATAEVGMAQGVRIAQDSVARPMSRANVEGLELEYETRGSGEPVVLVHAGIFADWFKPLVDEPALAGRYRVLSYHRTGYARSGRVTGPVSIAQQAAHLRALMRHLGIEKAHVVGHSSGGNIALQLALDAPRMVHSLVLMEPALPVAALGPERMLSTRAWMAPVLEAFRAGDKARAVDGFMRGVSGPGYRAVLDLMLPGAFEQAVVDADTFFGQELPAVQQWSLQRHDAARISRPALSVVGAKSKELSPIWTERHEMLLAWLPRAEGLVLPDATHLLHVEHPRAVAEALVAFFARHPFGTP
jgi:pimeloyl-ACP methyl ester carboxylesterase